MVSTEKPTPPEPALSEPERLTYDEAWEKAWQRVETGEDWEPILINTLDAEECEELYGEQRRVQLEDIGDGRLSAWLYEMPDPVHDSSAAYVQRKEMGTYRTTNEGSLFSRLPDSSDFSIEPGAFERHVGDYYEFFGPGSKADQRDVEPDLDSWAKRHRMHAVKRKNYRILFDAMLVIKRAQRSGAEQSTRITWNPFNFEVETTHRKLHQAIAHMAQAFRALNLGVLSTVLLDPNIAVGEKENFYAIYVQMEPVFDAEGKPTRQSRLSSVFDFGTKKYTASPANTKVLTMHICRRFDVTDVLGLTGPSLRMATDFDIAARLSSEEQAELQRSLDRKPLLHDNNPLSERLKQKLTVVITAESLYPKGEFRARSTPLSIDLHELLVAARRQGRNKKRKRSDSEEQDMDTPAEVTVSDQQEGTAPCSYCRVH